DILIAGTTVYDGDHRALCAILDEWVRPDASYAQRVSHLTNGGGLNRQYTLTPTTVYADAAPDTLTGSAGDDWFFVATGGSAVDKLEDRKPTETVTFTQPVAGDISQTLPLPGERLWSVSSYEG